MKLPPPNSQISEILYKMLTDNRGVSEREFNMNSFRSRISELRDVLNVKHVTKPFKNKYGRPSNYRVHFLTNTEKKKAVGVYKRMVQQ